MRNKKIINAFKPNLSLAKGSRLTSALFIGASMALAAGIIFGANIYYDIDTGKVMIEDTHQATTTQVTVDTATTGLTVTQRGTGAAFSATSTSAMTSDIFKITNLGSGSSFVVEDEDSDTSAFVVDNAGNIGIASSTPSVSFSLSVQGGILGSGNINLYGTATSTFGGVIDVQGFRMTTGSPGANKVLTTLDGSGTAVWADPGTVSGVKWTQSGDNLYPNELTWNVAVATTTARYDLDVWGNASFGTTSDYNTPLLLVDSYNSRVGISTSTPSNTFAVQGNIMSSGAFTAYGTATSTFGGVIDVQGFRMTTGSPGANKVLTTVDGSGTAVWTSISGVGGVTTTGGTAGTIAMFTGSQGIGDSAIIQNGTNIGIGNEAATSKLTVSGGGIAVSNDGSATTTISASATSTFATGIDAQGFKLSPGASSGYVLVSDASGVGSWNATDDITPSNWYFVSANAIAPTTSVGIIVTASSTIAATTTITNGLIVDGNTLYVMADNNRVGIASSTPSETFSVQGNILGSGNLVLYGSATSTISGDVSIQGLKISGDIWSADAITVTSQGGAITLAPASGSNADIVLGGAGLFRVGSSGQFYIDASGNVTTTGNIYADAFISTGENAYTRKVGDEILRGVVPVFGFDLPVRCNTSCNAGTYATVSRVVENDDNIFPMAFSGTTRQYRFSIRYADATTTATTRSVWQVATSSDPSYVSQFTLAPSDSEDLAKGFSTTTAFITLPTTDDWFLRVTTGNTGGYDMQVYEILLLGIDQVN